MCRTITSKDSSHIHSEHVWVCHIYNISFPSCLLFGSLQGNVLLALASSKVKPQTFVGWKMTPCSFHCQAKAHLLKRIPAANVVYKLKRVSTHNLPLKLFPRPPRTSRSNDAAMSALWPLFFGQRRGCYRCVASWRAGGEVHITWWHPLKENIIEVWNNINVDKK